MYKKGLVFWLTGLPCSGKTTISKKLKKYLKNKSESVQRLDGDILRKTISKDLGFSKKDRIKNIHRVAYLAKILADNGVNVIVALISPYQKSRDFARKVCPNFIEIYVKCSIEECKRRDIKGMYEKALKGKIIDFTGVQDSYEEPQNPEITIDTEKLSTEDDLKIIINYLKK